VLGECSHDLYLNLTPHMREQVYHWQNNGVKSKIGSTFKHKKLTERHLILSTLYLEISL